MKRRIAFLVALMAGVGLLIPDPVPFIDEAALLLIFVNAMAFLGYDVRRWLPFFSRGGKGANKPPVDAKSATVDV